MIGIDSSAIIDFFKGDMALKRLLEDLDELLVINQVSYLEVMFGLNFDKEEHQMEERFYDNLFSSLINLQLDNNACKKASKILWQLKTKGNLIELFDCAIAGIYLANGVDKIITKNVKHFSLIPGLKVINY
jgi:predicted nucleic acid-binding protein